jgi:hypothetical protein
MFWCFCGTECRALHNCSKYLGLQIIQQSCDARASSQARVSLDNDLGVFRYNSSGGIRIDSQLG